MKKKQSLLLSKIKYWKKLLSIESNNVTIPTGATGQEKNRLTVCLAVKAGGTKMKPYVVIRAKKVNRELSSTKRIIAVAT